MWHHGHCASVIMDPQVTGMSVGPVKLVYKNSNKVISTHVLLDIAFVIKSLADMGIEGTTTSITFKTLNANAEW